MIVRSFKNLVIVILVFVGCKDNIDKSLIKGSVNSNKEEISENFKLIFNGNNFDGWFQINKNNITGWEIINDNLVSFGTDESLFYRNTLSNFELELEWMLYKNANSGILYFISDNDSVNKDFNKLEYQIIDELNYHGKLEPYQKTGSCYGLYPAVNALIEPVGKYNTSRLLVHGNHVEHWLNGVKVVEYDIGSIDWNRRFTEKLKNNRNFTFDRKGIIALQSHNGVVCFRNIKIKEIN